VSLLEALGQLGTLDGLELVELIFERLETLFGQDKFGLGCHLRAPLEKKSRKHYPSYNSYD
jgi:hypothetical protein